MGTFDDLEDMAPLPLDATMTELLITGAVEIDDAPPGFDRVAGLINKAQGPATADELAGRQSTVTTFAAKVRSRPVVEARTRRTFGFPAKVFALAVPVVLLVGGVATATDSLPPSAQSAVSLALSSLGISVPKPQSDSHGIAGSPSSSTASATETGASAAVGPSSQTTVGLCRVWRVGGLNDHSTAYRHLVVAAGGAGRLPAYCGGALTSSAPDGATAHAKKLSSGQLDGRRRVTKPSTTGRQKTVAHADRFTPQPTAIRHSGAVNRGRASASTTALPTTTWGHRPKAPGTWRAVLGSSGRPSLSAGLLVPRGTHKAARSRGHRATTNTGKSESPASKTSTRGKPGKTLPVGASPVSLSPPVGRVSSERHGQTGRPSGCPVRLGHVILVHHHCHPGTPAGAQRNSTSTGSRRHDARPSPRGSSVGSQPRSVKVQTTM